MALVIKDILRKSLVESSCDRWLKVKTDNEAIADVYSKLNGGESRFGLEKNDVSFFYRKFECPEFFFYTKTDLLQYLYFAKEEYFNPSQNYWNKEFLKRHYMLVYKTISDLPNEIYKLKMYARYDYGTKYDSCDCQRAYLEFLSSKEDNIYAIFKQPIIATKSDNLIRKKNSLNKIPHLNQIEFVKIEDSETNKFFIYMKPTFTGKISPERLGCLLKEEVGGVQDLYVAHKVNLFGIKYAEYFKEDDIDTIVQNCGFTTCKIRGGDASVANILSTSLKSYEQIKAQSLFPNPFSSINETTVKAVTGIDSRVIRDSSETGSSEIQNIQRIYYGAPGTGKSNEIKKLTGEGIDNVKFSNDFTFRITFHPDGDYAGLVGAYKPLWDNGQSKIVYDFCPQTFLKAYVAAWTHPSENVALVIEEINRGNCAQIFGDIFQLLDREKNGLSKYPIESDIDMKGFLSRALSGEIKGPWAGTIPEDDKDGINEYYSKHYDDAFAKIKSGEILTLPKNLSILATMNTSDQSLFPMDSAFKRRWEWQYMPIVNANKNWVIHLADNYENIDWWEFLERINNVISDLTTSEDKQLGYFFCQPDEFVEANKEKRASDAKPDLISAKHFVNKVIFYLWNDVFKDYAFDAKCCKDSNSKEVLFADFYNKDGDSVNIETLKHFFETLTVENKPSLVEKIVPPTDASGEKELSKTDVSSVDEEPNSTDKVSEEADLFTSATTGE